MAVRRIDIAIPTVGRQAEPLREVKDDLRIGARFTRWRGDGLSELDERLRFRTDIEADFKRLALESGDDW